MDTLLIVAEGLLRAAGAAAFIAALSLIGSSLVPRSWQPTGRRLRLAFALSSGAILTGWTAWIAGAAFGTVASFVAAGALLVAALRRGREWLVEMRAALHFFSRFFRRQFALLLLLVALCALTIPQLLIPVVDSDGLRYHLAFPKLYLLTGAIDFYPWDVTGGFPHSAEMLYLLALPAGGEMAKYIHAFFFASNVALVILLVHRGRRSRAAAVLAGSLFAASPLVMAPAAAAFVDHIALYHVGVSLLILTRRGPSRSAAISAGAALATKITTAPAVLALAVMAIVRRERPVRAAAWFAGAAALLFLPFALRNIVHTGDPFYPIGKGLLRIPIEGVSESALHYATRYHDRLEGIVGIPWVLQDGVVADEVVGIHHLLGLFLIVLAVRWRAARPALAVVIAYLLVALIFRPPIRYLLPLVFCLAAFEGWALARLRPLAAGLIALAVAAPATLLLANTQLRRFAPFDLISGRVSEDAYLSAIVPGYRAARFVNAIDGGGRVMAVDFPSPYYFERPWIVEGILHQPPVQVWLHRGDSAEAVLQRLQQLEVRLLLVTPGYGGGKPWSMIPLGTDASSRIEATRLKQRLRLLGTTDGVDIYAVPPVGR